MYARTTSVPSESSVNHQRDEGPSERLIAPPELKARVNRRTSSMAFRGTYGVSAATANRLVATSASTTERKIVQNLFALRGMNLVGMFHPYGEKQERVSP